MALARTNPKLGSRKPGIVPQKQLRKRRSLPEYLDKVEVDVLIDCSPHIQARLLILLMWRAGLRVSEAIAVCPTDISFASKDGKQPPSGKRYGMLKVKNGKGGKDRLVPLHAELEEALRYVLVFTAHEQNASIVGAHRGTAHRWIKAAVREAEKRELFSPGRRVGNHTLRHSAARHWLSCGIPINVVSRWLGHANLSTTLIYLEILPDPLSEMQRVE